MFVLSLIFIIVLLVFWIIRLKSEIRIRKELEKRFENRKKDFEKLFDIAPFIIDSFDANGKCLLWNKECERIFGWTIEELNAHEDVFALFHPDPKDQEIMKEAFATRKGTEFIEQSPITKYGEVIPTRLVNVNLSDDEIIYIGIDLREQKAAEKELLKTQNELKALNFSLKERVENSVQELYKKEKLLLQQSRLAQMGEMLSIIAHQWRQPLSVIDMTAFNIRNKIDLDKFDLKDEISQEAFLKFLKEEIKDIHNYSQYLTNTIEDFTHFFKPNKEKELVNLIIPIEKALSILYSVITKEKIKIQVCNSTKNSINIFISEVMQVILNIVNNSIDNFIDKNTINPQINIDVEENDDKFTLKISDNGGGIDESILYKIFDPYFSTKTEKNGTGLGLYISKILIENYSAGLLNVNNIENGVCFEIVLYGDI